jgi:hypothetical protein
MLSLVGSEMCIRDRQRDGREPVIRSGFFCSWCPLLDSCAEGTKFIARRDDPDATDDF